MGTPLVHYLVDPRDQVSMKRALITSMRVIAAAGASHVLSLHASGYDIKTSFKDDATQQLVSPEVAEERLDVVKANLDKRTPTTRLRTLLCTSDGYLSHGRRSVAKCGRL